MNKLKYSWRSAVPVLQSICLEHVYIHYSLYRKILFRLPFIGKGAYSIRERLMLVDSLLKMSWCIIRYRYNNRFLINKVPKHKDPTSKNPNTNFLIYKFLNKKNRLSNRVRVGYSIRCSDFDYFGCAVILTFLRRGSLVLFISLNTLWCTPTLPHILRRMLCRELDSPECLQRR
jgi:hypothetical protein